MEREYHGGYQRREFDQRGGRGGEEGNRRAYRPQFRERDEPYRERRARPEYRDGGRFMGSGVRERSPGDRLEKRPRFNEHRERRHYERNYEPRADYRGRERDGREYEPRNYRRTEREEPYRSDKYVKESRGSLEESRPYRKPSYSQDSSNKM